MRRMMLLATACAAAWSADPAFTLVVNTQIPGYTASSQFWLRLSGAYTYDCRIDWGDGSLSTITAATDEELVHTYAVPGIHAIRITENTVGGFPTINFNNFVEAAKVTQLANWGDVTWTTMYAAFYGCSNMVITATDAATAKTGSVTEFSAAWEGCTSLTSFPVIDTHSGRTFGSTWSGCTSLSAFPVLDLGSATYVGGAWSMCPMLRSFPLLDTSSVGNFSGAWTNDTGLTSFPQLNTSSGTDFGYAWSGCSGLAEFPALDLSKGTFFRNAWLGCTGLRSFPTVDLGAASDLTGAWYECRGLASFPELDLPSASFLGYAWGDCWNLASVSVANTAGVFDFSHTWSGCTSLKHIAADMSHMSDGTGCFDGVHLADSDYSALLMQLAGTAYYAGVRFSGGNSQYQYSAEAARATLTTSKGWMISDGGPVGGGTVAPIITSPLTASGRIGAHFSYPITATNTPVHFAATGLPPGLYVMATTGVISGKPSAAGTYAATISAYNGGGSGEASLSITIGRDLDSGSDAGGCAAGATGVLAIALGLHLGRRRRT